MNDITNPQSDRINPDFVQQYIMANAKFFPEDSINELKGRLSKLSQKSVQRNSRNSIKRSYDNATFITFSWFLGY